LVSTNVPLDHWSYDAVEKLANYGLIDSAMLTMKPLSRIEMARHIAQAMYGLERLESPPGILESILKRLEEEFKGELILIQALDGWHGDSFVKPVEDPYVRYVYAEDPTGLENVRGDGFQRGSNYRAGFTSRATLFERAAFYLHPEYVDSAQGDSDIELIEGYGKVMVDPFEIEVGKDSLWWGPGHHGSILMSNNAQPFTMVKITNPQPLPLPWILRGLGPFKGQWFLTELQDDRDVPEARLSGIRLNIRPHPQLELGASRVVMFGGRGVPRVDCLDYFETFFARSEQEENNQLAGFDLSFLQPFGSDVPLRSLRFYADAAGEDEVGMFPSKWGYLLGLQLNDILRTGRTDVRFEYTDTHEVFYRHSLYTSGYTYEGRVIGHHVGTDARDMFVRLSHYLTDRVLMNLSFDRQTYRLAADAQATIDTLGCDLTVFLSRDWEVRTAYRYEEMSNARDDENHVFQLRLIRRF
jgi:hypothetical protein